MLRRFVSGSAIGGLVIPVATLVLLSIVGFASPRTWLTAIWCFVPLAWGIWAMLTPKSWMPARLPYWGAILGFVAGLAGAFILNLPARVFGATVPVAGRLLAVAVITIAYYFLWMLVRMVYESLSSPNMAVKSSDFVPEMKKAA